VLFVVILITGCNFPGSGGSSLSGPEAAGEMDPSPTSSTDIVEVSPWGESVTWRADQAEDGLYLDSGGDVDTELNEIGSPALPVRATGNGQALASTDGNTDQDFFMQFRVDDSFIFSGSPTSHVRILIEYYDQGTDSFSIEYDALAGGPTGDGRFKNSISFTKANTGVFQTAIFNLCDAKFANRDNGADFRIGDGTDGAELIRQVTVTLQPEGQATLNVDMCGANPWDAEPDSDAIQSCIDMTCSGSRIEFTSPGGDASYQGYLIDKTIFLVATSAKRDLTFTSTDPDDHASLIATEDLLGFVVRLWARSQVPDPGDIDDITFSHLDIDGGRNVRVCYGPNNIDDGIGDHWGSWLPECSQGGDPWCSPGGVAMVGGVNHYDPDTKYLARPDRWSTGLVVEDVVISNVECATALNLAGAAGSILNSTIDLAGDHVHEPGCLATDLDEGEGDWADGITFEGPAHLVSVNTIINASDVGIVHFGGVDTVIRDNTIRATEGNYGMFAGIAIHPWTWGNVSGGEVTGNTVISEGDSNCGGIHAGINIGTHMWLRGCTDNAWASARGTPFDCQSEPDQPGGTLCREGQPCQEWAFVAEGTTFTLQDNFVRGAQVNYLIEGLDLMGELIESGNISEEPRRADWPSSWMGCDLDGGVDFWGPLDFVAHHPSVDGWLDQRIHCTR
jgi:hypothetical protein